eukprot:m.1642622 g.1642622  ORF g.1642622 m.1642622 type:complete len:64 (+) comp54264_c0_seq1:27-218(+)
MLFFRRVMHTLYLLNQSHINNMPQMFAHDILDYRVRSLVRLLNDKTVEDKSCYTVDNCSGQVL